MVKRTGIAAMALGVCTAGASAQLGDPFASTLVGDPIGLDIGSIASASSVNARVTNFNLPLVAAVGFAFPEERTLRTLRFWEYEPDNIQTPIGGFIIKIRTSTSPGIFTGLPDQTIFEKIVFLTDIDSEFFLDAPSGDATQYTVDLGQDIILDANTEYFFTPAAFRPGEVAFTDTESWFHLRGSASFFGLQIGTIYFGRNDAGVESDVTPITSWSTQFVPGPVAFEFYSEPLEEPCVADFNGDGSVDFFDQAAFLDAFEANDTMADIDGDGDYDTDDVDAFQTEFGEGC